MVHANLYRPAPSTISGCDTCSSIVIPAVVLDDVPEVCDLGGWTRIAEDVFIVSIVIHVRVDGDEVDVLKSDVDPDSGLSIPEEIRHLFVVRDVVSRFQVPDRVQVFHEQLLRMNLHTQSFKNEQSVNTPIIWLF